MLYGTYSVCAHLLQSCLSAPVLGHEADALLVVGVSRDGANLLMEVFLLLQDRL